MISHLEIKYFFRLAATVVRGKVRRKQTVFFVTEAPPFGDASRYIQSRRATARESQELF